MPITRHPPHRTVRADFPHTAPTLDGERASADALFATRSSSVSRRVRSESMPRLTEACSPWSGPFPPATPRPSPRSPPSPVLWADPTSPLRSHPDCRLCRSRIGLFFRHRGDLPVPVQKVSQRAWGLGLRRYRTQLAIYRCASFCLPLPITRSASGMDFSKLDVPARCFRCLRFNTNLAIRTARLAARVVRYAFSVGLFHPLLSAGLPAHNRTISKSNDLTILSRCGKEAIR